MKSLVSFVKTLQFGARIVFANLGAEPLSKIPQIFGKKVSGLGWRVSFPPPTAGDPQRNCLRRFAALSRSAYGAARRAVPLANPAKL